MRTEEQVTKMAIDAKMREAWGIRVYVVGGGFQYVKMFFDAGLCGARYVEEADVICFTGGEDVDPGFYAEEAIPGTHFNTSRDNKESAIYAEAMMTRKPMIGICRGAQFLNVMNGGKLWQDVNNHANGGKHDVLDVKSGTVRHNMTSTHHQMMRPTKDAEILATACLSTYKHAQVDQVKRDQPEQDDVEVVWYPDSLSLCFQPHPEFTFGECRNYFLELFDNYITPAT
jgi:hypothetical protein